MFASLHGKQKQWSTHSIKLYTVYHKHNLYEGNKSAAKAGFKLEVR